MCSTLYTLNRTYICLAKLLTSIMQTTCIFFPKWILFRTAMQRFCMNQYPGFIHTETQPYIFPIVGLRFVCKLQEFRNPTLNDGILIRPYWFKQAISAQKRSNFIFFFFFQLCPCSFQLLFIVFKEAFLLKYIYMIIVDTPNIVAEILNGSIKINSLLEKN